MRTFVSIVFLGIILTPVIDAVIVYHGLEMLGLDALAHDQPAWRSLISLGVSFSGAAILLPYLKKIIL